MVLLFTLTAIGCSGTSFLRTAETTNITAKEILYQARILDNKGVITASDFTAIRNVYDRLIEAERVAVQARVDYLKVQTAAKEQRMNVAIHKVEDLMRQLITLALKYGIIKGGE